MEYIVVTGNSLNSLMNHVNDFLGRGWQLQGGVCVYVSDAIKKNYYAQAMFKVK